MRRHYLHLEVIHGTGAERFRAAGPRVRLGEGGSGQCALAGAAAGAWVELEVKGDAVEVAGCAHASMEGRALRKGMKVPPGSLVTVGNALVTLIAVSEEEEEEPTPSKEPAAAEAVTEDAGGKKTGGEEPQPAVFPPVSVESESPPEKAAQPSRTAPPEPDEGRGDAASETAPAEKTAGGESAATESAAEAGKETGAKETKGAPGPALIIHDGGTPRRIEIPAGEAVLGSDPACAVPLKGKWISKRHAVLRLARGGAAVEVLRGFDHTTLAGEFRRSGKLRDGEWLVMGEARVMLDLKGREIWDVKPPPPVRFGASFSPLSAARKAGEGAAAVARWAKASPAVFFSVVFHLLLLAALLFFTVSVKPNDVIITLSSSLEEPAAEEEPPEPEEEIQLTEERVDEFQEFSLEEFEEEVGEEGEGNNPLSALGEGGGDGDWLPPITPEQGLLPRRPPPKGAPTLVQMRRRGLDIVFLFDTTASMGWLLDDVKRSIETIYNVTFRLVKNTRFACVAYRDVKPVEEYVTKTLPFTSSLPELKHFLVGLDAAGGGDLEEAVQEGLKRISKLQWRKRAYKVVIIFADAPCHLQHRNFCFRWVKRFRRDHGYFHAVHAMRGVDSDEDTREFLSEMAKRGGGEMVPISQEARVLGEILRLVFGSGNKEAVEEAMKTYRRRRSSKEDEKKEDGGG